MGCSLVYCATSAATTAVGPMRLQRQRASSVRDMWPHVDDAPGNDDNLPRYIQQLLHTVADNQYWRKY